VFSGGGAAPHHFVFHGHTTTTTRSDPARWSTHPNPSTNENLQPPLSAFLNLAHGMDNRRCAPALLCRALKIPTSLVLSLQSGSFSNPLMYLARYPCQSTLTFPLWSRPYPNLYRSPNRLNHPPSKHPLLDWSWNATTTLKQRMMAMAQNNNMTIDIEFHLAAGVVGDNADSNVHAWIWDGSQILLSFS